MGGGRGIGGVERPPENVVVCWKCGGCNAAGAWSIRMGGWLQHGESWCSATGGHAACYGMEVTDGCRFFRRGEWS